MLTRSDLAAAVGRRLREPVVEVLDWSADEVVGSTGRATAQVNRLRGTARDQAGRVRPWRLTVKGLRRPDGGACLGPQHWTYWRREALAYESTLLPHAGDGLLRGAECFGVFPDAVALETVDADEGGWDLDRFTAAAHRLGCWQAAWLGRVPPVDWLAEDQLAQRITSTDAAGGLVEPDWGQPALAAVFPADVQAGLRATWARRWALLARLAPCPTTLTHGDFSRGNLLATGPGPGAPLVVIDWAALGRGPAGFDLAHLVLSASHVANARVTLVDAYLGAIEPRWHPHVGRAYAVTAALTATSRLCWTLARTTDPAIVDHWARLVPWIVALARDAERP